MGNFEKLSVLVIVVIIVMILVVALYTWTDNPDAASSATDSTTTTTVGSAAMNDPLPVGPFPPAPPPGTRTPIIAPLPGGNLPATPPAPGPNPMTDTRDGAIPPVPAVIEPRSETPAEPRVHVVASGDNLTKIARKYFNSTGQRFIDAIARANPGVDPNRLKVNQKLQIPGDVPAPKMGSSDGTVAVERPAPASGSGPKAGSVYTVRRGDKLPDIARRAYGSSENWHLIWLENFTTIRDPDEVASGTKLKIPHVN